jgi:hypothetical protein
MKLFLMKERFSKEKQSGTIVHRIVLQVIPPSGG